MVDREEKAARPLAEVEMDSREQRPMRSLPAVAGRTGNPPFDRQAPILPHTQIPLFLALVLDN